MPMRDTQFYSTLLGLKDPWKVPKVVVDFAAGRVDVWIKDFYGAQWGRPEGAKKLDF
jgi:hypothetical protein